MEIQVEGLQETRQALDRLRALPGVLARVALSDGLLAQARVAAEHAKTTALFQDRSGRLRKSIGARKGQRRYGASAILIANEPHAHLVHRGTIQSSARPFLTKAVQDSRSEGLQAFVRAVRRRESRVSAELAGRRRVSGITRRGLAG